MHARQRQDTPSHHATPMADGASCGRESGISATMPWKCPGPRVPSGKIKFDIPRATPRSHENEFFPAHDFVLKLSAAYKQLPGRSSKIDSSYALQQLAMCVPLLRNGPAVQAAQLRQPLRISAGTSVTSVSMTRSLDPMGPFQQRYGWQPR